MALIVKGQVWKFGDRISTDLMQPGFTPSGASPEVAAQYCMRSNRPDFAEQVQPGDIIVGGQNFGCGSSRAAAQNLVTLRVGCVLAESIARIFFRNAINLGFPVLPVPTITEFCAEGDEVQVNFQTGEIRNLTTGKIMHTAPLSEDSPPMQILKAGGMMAILENEYLKNE